MRQIQKQAINKNVANELVLKQQKIDDETVKANWKLSDNQRIEIENKLFISQKYLCCYCECEIDEFNFHIEHFYERHDRPQMIYNYQDNLLLSCEGDKEKKSNYESNLEREARINNISCGHKKSKTYHNNVEIDYSLLINPMTISSNLISYTNGYIDTKNNCNQSEENQVIYTKNRLQIDIARLNNMRTSTIEKINSILKDLNIEQQKKFISDLLDQNQNSLPAFYSTIKSNFEFIINE